MKHLAHAVGVGFSVPLQSSRYAYKRPLPLNSNHNRQQTTTSKGYQDEGRLYDSHEQKPGGVRRNVLRYLQQCPSRQRGSTARVD